jgi:hypothetical protein
LPESELAPFEATAQQGGELGRALLVQTRTNCRLGPPSDRQVEGERMKIVSCSVGRAAPRQSGLASRFLDLHWVNARRGARLVLAFSSPVGGAQRVRLALGRGREFGIVQLSINGHALGDEPVDCFNTVTAIDPFNFDATLVAGENELVVEFTGANAGATADGFFALDYLKIGE